MNIRGDASDGQCKLPSPAKQATSAKRDADLCRIVVRVARSRAGAFTRSRAWARGPLTVAAEGSRMVGCYFPKSRARRVLAAAAALTLALTGCGDAGPGESVGRTSSAI